MLGPGFWRRALADPAVPGDGPYGPLATTPDANGLFLPAGFVSRVVAVGGESMPGRGYTWHPYSDGAGTFAQPDGGWVLTSNSEVPATGSGGAGALRFGPDGAVIDACRILDGTTMNCAGGVTPWGTWFSCEETDRGLVWECDPLGERDAVALPLLGRFAHEAAVVDPATGQVYLTEDSGDARLYRFTPTTTPAVGTRPDLSAGILEVAAVGSSGRDTEGEVTWVGVDPEDPAKSLDTRSFVRLEGIWYHAGFVFFVASTFSEIYALDLASQVLEQLYTSPPDPVSTGPLTDADNLTVHHQSGDLYVTEDVGNLEVCLLTADAEREIAAFSRVDGQAGSELTGPVFDPSGTRLYFASQRGGRTTALGDGVIYEITGPFRATTAAAVEAATSTGGPDPAREDAPAAVASVTAERAHPAVPSAPEALPATGATRSPLAAAAFAAGAVALRAYRAATGPRH